MCRRILEALQIGLEENLCILVRSVQRRVLVYQSTVYVDTYVKNESVDHG